MARAIHIKKACCVGWDADECLSGCRPRQAQRVTVFHELSHKVDGRHTQAPRGRALLCKLVAKMLPRNTTTARPRTLAGAQALAWSHDAEHLMRFSEPDSKGS